MNKAIGGAVAVALAVAPLPTTAAAIAADAPSAGGMGSPDAAVQELLDAARASDPLGLLAVLEPAERSLVKSIYDRSGAAAESAGGVDIDALLLALHIDIQATPLTVEQLADDVAWVTTDSVGVDLDIDMAAADAALAVDLSQADFTGAGLELEPVFDDLGLAVVREGDAWFVSALYTAAEIGRRSAGEPLAYTSAATGVTPAATPDAAVAALLAAVSAKDVAAVSAALTGYESGLVGDFSGNIGAALLEAAQPYDVTLTPERMQVVEQTDDRAVVEVVDWTALVTGGDSFDSQLDTTLDVSGECGDLRVLHEGGEYEESGGCLFDTPTILDPLSVLPELGWAGVRFVTVNEDGGWRVSLLQSVLGTIAPTITDAVAAAGLAEVAGSFVFEGGSDGFYETLVTLAGAGASTAPPGQSVITPSGNGRIAVFAVEGPATLAVDVDGVEDEWSCAMYVGGGEDSGFGSPVSQCGETARVEAGRAVVVVTAGGGLFSANEPIGTVIATVTPG